MRLAISLLVLLLACSSDDGGPAPHEGAATCDSLCTRLEGCDALPDEACFNGDCDDVVCRDGCANLAAQVRQDVLDELQTCFDDRSCDELASSDDFGTPGYQSACIATVVYDGSRAIPADNAATCNSVRAAAETACSSDECARNVEAITGNCDTAARFEAPAYLTESTSCESEDLCLDLHQCVAAAVCPSGLGFDVAVLCPMQGGWDC